MLITVIVFLVILSVLVLIHELGHFLVAKKLGIKVEEFGFGIPPRAFGKKIGETIYSINWLPIGGFVKLFGEDEAGAGRINPTKNHEPITKNLERAYYTRPVWQRAAVVGAGVVMNTVLAIVVYYIFLSMAGFKTEIPLLGKHDFFLVNQVNRTDIIVTAVAKNSPAEKAGMKPFSRIVSVNGKDVTKTEAFLAVVRENKGKEITLVWEDIQSKKQSQAVIVPRINPPKNEGALGVGFYDQTFAYLNYDTPGQKLISGFVHPANLMVYNAKLIGDLVASSFKNKTAKPIGEAFSGPVGIYSIVDIIVKIPDLKERVMQVLNLAGLISISLAFFNLLPIPALDGGRLFFILIEGITRKKVSPKIESYAHAIGFALLLTLLLLVTIKDIGKLLIR